MFSFEICLSEYAHFRAPEWPSGNSGWQVMVKKSVSNYLIPKAITVWISPTFNFSKQIWSICHMHQTIFEYLCIFCPLYVIHLILQRKEILWLGANTSFCSNISSCWQRITVCLGKTNSEILQSTHLHNAQRFANLNNGQNHFLDWVQIKYSPVNLSKRSTFPI